MLRPACRWNARLPLHLMRGRRGRNTRPLRLMYDIRYFYWLTARRTVRKLARNIIWGFNILATVYAFKLNVGHMSCLIVVERQRSGYAPLVARTQQRLVQIIFFPSPSSVTVINSIRIHIPTMIIPTKIQPRVSIMISCAAPARYRPA